MALYDVGGIGFTAHRAFHLLNIPSSLFHTFFLDITNQAEIIEESRIGDT